MTEKPSKRPPRKIDYNDDLYFDSVASATEVTGLIPTPPASDDEAEAYEQLSDIHRQKPMID